MRKPGFYWVMTYSRQVLVAEWVKGGGWFLPGMIAMFSDSDFKKISGEKLKKP